MHGALWGLLVGDALGVPFEFHDPDALPPQTAIGPDLPVGFQRSHTAAPKGAWSDDGAHALCLMESLLACGELDTRDLLSRMSRWFREGHLAVEGIVFDIGNGTREALVAFDSGCDPERCGSDDELANGNGSLMRVLPLALWHVGRQESDETLVAEAMRQSRITHGHLRAQLCCALYCLWARTLAGGAGGDSATAEGRERAWHEAVGSLASVVPSESISPVEWAHEVKVVCGPAAPVEGGGSGYVVDSLQSARWALQGEDYRAVIQRAISLGEDTDTTAAVAGGLAGLCWGTQGVPPTWMEHLAGRPVASAVITPFVEACLRR